MLLPNGWTGEYDGWEPQKAWQRTVQVAQQAERLGFDSIWMWDHFHRIIVTPNPDGGSPTVQPGTTDEMVFETYTSLAALAMSLSSVTVVLNALRLYRLKL